MARFGVDHHSDRPKNHRQLINRAPSTLVQPIESLCPQASEYFSIRPLHLAVAPWVRHGSETDLAAEVLGVLHEGVACELRAVSVMTLFGTPKRQTSPLMNLTANCAVTFLNASTSGHFVNLSIATYKYSKPLMARGKGLNMSSPRTEKGQERGMV